MLHLTSDAYLLHHLARYVSYIAMAKVLYHMDSMQNFSANFFIPTLMDFEKHFDTFFTLANGCENLKYDSITKFKMDSKVLSYGGLFAEFFTVVNCM
jgi:hypothetical protein